MEEACRTDASASEDVEMRLLTTGLLLFSLSGSSAFAQSSEADKQQMIAAAKVLAGGDIGEDATSNTLIVPVASRLIARGAVADKLSGLRGQAELAITITHFLGVDLMSDSSSDMDILKLASALAVLDYKELGRNAWCIDYKTRALPAAIVAAKITPHNKRNR